MASHRKFNSLFCLSRSSLSLDSGHGQSLEKLFVWPVQVATSSQRRSTWWGPSELQWQNYRIENMPSRTKPLLVFVNTKSGPMLGHMLRRKFLRLLNPLQVGVLPYFACAD